VFLSHDGWIFCQELSDRLEDGMLLTFLPVTPLAVAAVAPNMLKVFKGIRKLYGNYLSMNGENTKRIFPYSPNTPREA
jgi:hypothetical protein